MRQEKRFMREIVTCKTHNLTFSILHVVSLREANKQGRQIVNIRKLIHIRVFILFIYFIIKDKIQRTNIGNRIDLYSL